MSDEPIDGDPEPEPQPENHDMKQLRAKARATDDAKAEADALRRELAFSKAGIDPDDPRQGYFVRGYNGDLTATAIKEAAEAAGFLGQANTSEPQGMSEAERQAFATSSQAAAAGNPEAPVEDIYADFRNKDARRNGVSPEQFAISIAQKLEENGGLVAYDGPFREWKGDTGLIPRPGTPVPPRI